MEIFAGLRLGFQTALTPFNLLYCLIGVFIGTLIGVLPGLGPAATVAMLMPASFVLPPVSALIMLAGIYYGAQYGGSTTSILVNLPGEASSIVTTLDGYQMALTGPSRCGPGHRGHRFLFRGHRLHRHHRPVCAPARQRGPQVRPARVLFPDGHWASSPRWSSPAVPCSRPSA